MSRLEVSVEVDAPPEKTWAVLVDWERQSEWIVATKVIPEQDANRVGGRLTAVTGIAGRGVVDEMEIVEWDPPRRCVVQHIGKGLTGIGIFEIEPLEANRSRITWIEDVAFPSQRINMMGWPGAQPLLATFWRRSLKKFARIVAAG